MSESNSSYPPQPRSKVKKESGPAKGFCNATAVHRETLLENVHGDLPEFLNGDFFFVGPGTYNVFYTKQGNLESETKRFSVSHMFDV
jgi:hypothetical protein